MARLGPVLVLALSLAIGSACDESRAEDDTPSGQGTSSPKDDQTEVDDTKKDDGGSKSAERPEPPPVDRSCSSDGDCVVTRTLVEGRWVCCGGCGLVAASASWKKTFDAFCEEQIPEPRTCPRYRCPMKEGRPRCRDGTCVVEPIP